VGPVVLAIVGGGGEGIEHGVLGHREDGCSQTPEGPHAATRRVRLDLLELASRKLVDERDQSFVSLDFVRKSIPGFSETKKFAPILGCGGILRDRKTMQRTSTACFDLVGHLDRPLSAQIQNTSHVCLFQHEWRKVGLGGSSEKRTRPTIATMRVLGEGPYDALRRFAQ
jgi:hypothetical protein